MSMRVRDVSMAIAAATQPTWSVRDRAGDVGASAPLDVLVLDAQHRQALTCTRVYGCAGLRTGSVACEAEAAAAPSFHSRWSRIQATMPDVTHNADGYVDALLALLQAYPTRMILPGHDGSIEALRARRAEIERVTALPLASDAALDIAVSKTRTLALAASLGIAVPRSVLITSINDLRAALAEVGLPAVVKPVQSWVERDGIGVRLNSDIARTPEEAEDRVSFVLDFGGQVVLQQWLPGRREAVSLLYAHKRFWARFAQVSHREFPPLGGVSVFCESIPLLPDISHAAELLVRAADLEGCSMVEFRRDASGMPVLMEINPRMGGSVALAVASGVNFPELVYAWALGEPLTQVASYRSGQRLRWIGGDIWNLKHSIHPEGNPDVPPFWRAATTFVSDFVLRPGALDFVDAHDWKPALVEAHQTIWRPFLRKMRKAPVIRQLAGTRKAV